MDDAADVGEPSPFDAAFASPDGTEWHRPSRALRTYRRVVALVSLAVLAALGGVGLWMVAGWLELALWGVAVVIATGMAWYLAGVAQQSLGHAEGRSDFYLTNGVLVRQLVIIPYGRMQLVDVTTNLLEQMFGIATVRVRTAATPGEASVVGLPIDEATALRDRLTERSETFSTGL
nr:PH domain-containing protein [Spiractinospora alimapuensis]